MAFNFKQSLKKVADAAIGTEGTKDFGKGKKEFQDYESMPEYDVSEPAQWTGMQGEERIFTIEGYSIKVNANLDTCMNYYPLFVECANYYMERFRFKYSKCMVDYDTFVHYFEKMYTEGFDAMTQRAYGLLLPLGIFDMEYSAFQKIHLESYHTALDFYDNITAAQKKKTQNSFQAAGMVADQRRVDMVSSTSMSGLQSARMKADLRNFGTTLLTTAVAASLSKLSPAQKAEIWENMDSAALFRNVYTDYLNTFFTLLQILCERGLCGNVSIGIKKETTVIYNNLKNPMFPEAQFLPTIVKIIAENPFVPAFYALLEEKLGATDEVRAIEQYFIR